MREPADIRDLRQEPYTADSDRTGAPLSTADVADATATTQEEARIREQHNDATRSGDGHDTEPTPLFRPDEAGGFRTRWETVQAAFVDDPRHAVEDADHLVAEAIQKLARTFADERTQLEHQWHGGGDVSTEDLRLALQKYRSFFERLLAA